VFLEAPIDPKFINDKIGSMKNEMAKEGFPDSECYVTNARFVAPKIYGFTD